MDPALATGLPKVSRIEPLAQTMTTMGDSPQEAQDDTDDENVCTSADQINDINPSHLRWQMDCLYEAVQRSRVGLHGRVLHQERAHEPQSVAEFTLRIPKHIDGKVP